MCAACLAKMQPFALLGKSGKVEVTPLYKQLYEAAGDIKPKNISIDILSRAFAGNEIDRGQVYGFAMHMQALAMVAGGSVTVLSHPSLAGISSGSGISGSTAWHGAFRFRQYLKGAKADERRTARERICGNLSSRKTSTAQLASPLCSEISAACFCQRRGFPVSTKRRESKRPRKSFCPSWLVMTGKIETSATSRHPTTTRRPTSAKRVRRKVCAGPTLNLQCGDSSQPGRFASRPTASHRGPTLVL